MYCALGETLWWPREKDLDSPRLEDDPQTCISPDDSHRHAAATPAIRARVLSDGRAGARRVHSDNAPALPLRTYTGRLRAGAPSAARHDTDDVL